MDAYACSTTASIEQNRPLNMHAICLTGRISASSRWNAGYRERMARYPQLFSRVGFVHHYRPLLNDELPFVLTRHWRGLGLTMDEADLSDS